MLVLSASGFLWFSATHQALLPQLRLQLRRLEIIAVKSHHDAALLQGFQLPLLGRVVQHHIDLGACARERPQYAGNGLPLSMGEPSADVDTPLLARRNAPDVFGGQLDVGADVVGMPQQRLSGLSQLNPRTGAGEQLDPELLFERLDVPGKWWAESCATALPRG